MTKTSKNFLGFGRKKLGLVEFFFGSGRSFLVLVENTFLVLVGLVNLHEEVN